MSSFYPANWISKVIDNWGAASRLRVLVRDKTNALIDVTATEFVTGANPIDRESERSVGVAQGQTWEVETTRSAALSIPSAGLDGCACQIRAVLDQEDEPLATGVIRKISQSSDAFLTINVEDALVRLVKAKFPHDYGWYSSAFAGLIYQVDASTGYNNDWNNDGVDEGVVKLTAAFIPTGAWRIVFTSATAFDVYDPLGVNVKSGTISADLNVHYSTYGSGNPGVTIKAAGWDTTTGAYASGDEFTFGTTMIKTGQALSPVELIRDLMDDVAEISVRDPLTGSIDTNARYGEFSGGAWWEALADTSSDIWGGTFRMGDSVIDAIQGILRVYSWAMFCAPDGTLALHRPVIGEDTTVDLRGDWGPGGVNVISTRRTESMGTVANVVRYIYLNSDGTQAQVEYRDDSSPYDDEMAKEFDIPWIVPHAVIRVAAGRTLGRLQRAREIFTSRTTFAGAALVPGEQYTLHDPAGQADGEGLTASRVSVDAVGDVAAVEGFIDVLASENIFIIGDATTDPVGSRIGGLGDPGAGQIL